MYLYFYIFIIKSNQLNQCLKCSAVSSQSHIERIEASPRLTSIQILVLTNIRYKNIIIDSKCSRCQSKTVNLITIQTKVHFKNKQSVANKFELRYKVELRSVCTVQYIFVPNHCISKKIM